MEQIEVLCEGRVRISRLEKFPGHYQIMYSRKNNSIGIYTTLRDTNPEKARHDFLKNLDLTNCPLLCSVRY